MMKEAKPFVYVYAQRVECEEPCEGRLSRTVLWEGEGETPSLYSTFDSCSRANNNDLQIMWVKGQRKSRFSQIILQKTFVISTCITNFA